MLPQHRGAARGKAATSSTETYIKYGAIAIFSLLCIKFLFFVDPLALEDVLPFEEKSMYKFTTKYGQFTVELFPKHAPKTVAQFEKLVMSGFYKNNAGFYRAEPGFVVQGGGFVHDKPSPFGNLPVEYSLESDERMVVLARNKDPASGNTEFSVMLTDNSHVNAPQGSSPGYTAFGRVYSGYPTLVTIANEMAEGFLSKTNKDQAVPFLAIDKVTQQSPTADDLRAVSDAIHDAIATRFSVVMFSKTTCPYCKKAKAILKEIGAEVHAVELDLLPPAVASQYQDVLDVYTGRRTVPNIILNGRSIGGGDDVEALHEAGKLTGMVEKTGALAKQGVVLEAIRKHPLVVFTKSFDPYSKDVQEVLKVVGATPHVIEIDTHPQGDAVLYYLIKMTGRKTTPNVFVGGKTIGGCDDTKTLHGTGELTLLLQQAGAL
ncbi:Aste57867_24893 [Aphanomyces stellatus]|uniref:Aste57867_24893 protein n=1 Tax=Aphanomyces stellatus TaxID=120398 RepID=A0A485LRN2_9STRA|nr:hypothetical protein As57867_024815 [Aphanomyces stellatus]VFU01527.1 Aste57867_24893 [Aphanomyces stellatus]